MTSTPVEDVQIGKLIKTERAKEVEVRYRAGFYEGRRHGGEGRVFGRTPEEATAKAISFLFGRSHRLSVQEIISRARAKGDAS